MFYRSRTRHSRRHRRGVASVEMAMVAPVIFMLIFGSIEFARLMMVRQGLTNAAREGCRSACLLTTRDNHTAETAVRNALKSLIANATKTQDLRIQFEPPITATLESDAEITAQVEIDFADVSWLPPFFTAGASIRGVSTMHRE